MNPSKEQQIFIDAEGKIVLCACPGSGKTFAIAYKTAMYIKNWEEAHKGIAVLTFTNVAKDEIIKQISDVASCGQKVDYPHFIGTIDSFLNQYIFTKFAYLLTSQNSKPFLAQYNINIPFKWWRSECHRNRCIDEIQNFRWNVDGETYLNNKQIDCDPGPKGRPCDQYKKILMNRGIFFQNDVSFICLELLKKFPNIAEAIAERFPVIFLDEAQDTSKEQMAIFDVLVNSGVKTFCLVGDPDQSIYEWRNAHSSEILQKMGTADWNTLMLTENRRSSQAICNATKYFSSILELKSPSIAVGENKNCAIKPELILISDQTPKEKVIEYFLNKCKSYNINIESNSVAFLTRGKIHKDIAIKNLWKSTEVEMLAQASYLWRCGSRREAHNLCCKSLYSIYISELQHEIDLEIEKFMPYDVWKDFCLNITINLPSAELDLSSWVKALKEYLNKIDFVLPIREGRTINDIIKIKKTDKAHSNFQSLQIKQFFEKKSLCEYTVSSIHGIKGESYEAICLYAPKAKGATITRASLTQNNLSDEVNRLAYVAMTRPKKYLAIVLLKPNAKTTMPLNRFPYDLWDYFELE